MIGNIQVSSR